MKKLFLFLILVLVFSARYSVLDTKAAETDPGGMPTPTSTRPQDKGFSPLKYNCLQTTDEFGALRPYPGSPCDPLIPAQTTFQCGKSINAEGNFLVPLDGEGLPTCPDGSGDICLDKQIAFDLNVDLRDAKLPVLGNTQDNLDDAAKANQYLASYLNGTVQQADQGPLLGTDRLTSFAGPLKKLLPFDIQNGIRSQVADNRLVGNNIGYAYHNYKIGCREQFNPQKALSDFLDNTLKDLVLVKDLLTAYSKFQSLGLYLITKPEVFSKLSEVSQKIIADGKAKPENLTEVSQIFITAGLSDIADTASTLITSFTNAFSAYLNLLNNIFLQHSASCLTSTDVVRLKDEAGHLPPNPKNFTSFSEYWDKYIKWLGKLNVFNIFTIDLPWVPDVWAELFQNVPFATLEDTVGEVTLSTHEGSQPTGVSDMNLTFKNGDSKLYFAHLKNTNAMATLLAQISRPKSQTPTETIEKTITQDITTHQKNADNIFTKIYCALNPKGCDNSQPTTPRQEIPNTVYSRVNFDQTCDISEVAVKTKGDDLMGGQISAKLTYNQKIRYTPLKYGDKNANDKCFAASECRSGCCLKPGEDPRSANCPGVNDPGAVLALTDPETPNATPTPINTCVGPNLSCINWASSCESIGQITTPGNCGGTGLCCLSAPPTPTPTPFVSNKRFDPETCSNPQVNINGTNYGIDSYKWLGGQNYSNSGGDRQEIADYICRNVCNKGQDSVADSYTTNYQQARNDVYYPFPGDANDPDRIKTNSGGYDQFTEVKCWVPRYCRASPKISKPTKAKASVFSKMPLIDSIYETLISSKDSFLRHLTPKDSDIKPNDQAQPVGLPVNYTGGPASDNPAGDIRDVKVSAGRGNGSTPVVYLPKVGSLGDYLLGTFSPETVNLQKMFRPKE